MKLVSEDFDFDRSTGMKKRNWLRGVCAITLALAGLGMVQAQSYPTKPVRLIVPFPAGGATDLFARTLSQKIGEKLGQSVVVENRPGAGGTLGADLAAKASPDGYTLLLSTSSTHSMGPNLNPRRPYDAVRDFMPVVHLGNAPSIMRVPNNSPAKWPELPAPGEP
jgi:tripartite-type tricarboxylate transporter receptor subunit TctC